MGRTGDRSERRQEIGSARASDGKTYAAQISRHFEILHTASAEMSLSAPPATTACTAQRDAERERKRKLERL